MSFTNSPVSLPWENSGTSEPPTTYPITESADMTTRNEGPDLSTIVAKQRIQNIFGPILFTVVILGLLGNVTSIAVMSTKAFRKMAISRPIRCLALSDSLYLVCIINNQPWFQELMGIDLRALSPASCKLVNWMTRSTAIFSAWMVILLAAERFLAVWFFEVVRRIFSVQKMTGCILAIVLITATFNAVWTLHSDAVLGGRCIANAREDDMTKNFLAACVFLYVGIPAPVLLLLNVLIIVRLQLHSRNGPGQGGSVRIPQHRVTAMLLAVTTVFILFVPPIALCHMVAQFLGENLFATTQLPLFITGQTAQLLFGLNCAVNFYLYVVMGSTFRNKLLAMLCSRWKGSSTGASGGSANTKHTRAKSYHSSDQGELGSKAKEPVGKTVVGMKTEEGMTDETTRGSGDAPISVISNGNVAA